MTRNNDQEQQPLLQADLPPVKYLDNEARVPAPTPPTSLRRGLSARQVQMIAIGGTIGTGLFLGTGRSLANGGPGAMLVCYSLTGFVVYITLLLLGEMGTQYPVAGSFNAYAARFVDDAFGFAVAWNYWFNDAVSVASDLVAAQIILGYWTIENPWIISLIFLIFLLSVNAFHVGAYGELEYWLSSLKVVTIVLFIIIGTFVNLGVNREHRFIGLENFTKGDAPFVGGFGGFATVFVTASFAYGGTESLGITAGETQNPTKNMPKVVKFVFFRILLFYILSIFIIGLNVPYTYPNLSNNSITTSPFTIVFSMAGSNAAAAFMNSIILTSVLSAGNHALFAGTRILHSLALSHHAPSFLARTNRNGVPYLALLATSSVSALCFGSSFVGRGQLWVWLQTIVGVSNQIAWISIGLASWRFRKAWQLQGRSLSELKFHMPWTRTWGPPFVVITVSLIILIQGWSSFIPKFSPVEFISLYMQVPVLLIFFLGWKFIKGTSTVDLQTVDLQKDQYDGHSRRRSEGEVEDDVESIDEDVHESRVKDSWTPQWLWRGIYNALA